MTATNRYQQVSAALLDGDLQAAVACLNDGVPHRFTAVYRLTGELLQVRAIHDKQSQVTPSDLLAIPLRQSLCQFAIRAGSLETRDSTQDRRLNDIALHAPMVAYTGVPITDGAASNKVIGTLCHFDFVPQEISDDEYALLRQVSTLMDLRNLVLAPVF